MPYGLKDLAANTYLKRGLRTCAEHLANATLALEGALQKLRDRDLPPSLELANAQADELLGELERIKARYAKLLEGKWKQD